MNAARFVPASLARRFALVAAGLAAGAVMVVSVASWWLINRQHDEALRQLHARETQFHAAAVGSDLQALASRMTEIGASTILATGLVDSAGRETYLAPFLAGIRHVNGIPLQVLFTDFEGKEIASNGDTAFAPSELAWLRRALNAGRPSAAIASGPGGDALIAVEPITYTRTASPEGALLYKVALKDLRVPQAMTLEWGAPGAAASPGSGAAAPVPVPPVFESLQFRMRDAQRSAAPAALRPQYLAIFLIALTLFIAVVVAGTRLARLLTGDLQRLQAFSSRFIGAELSRERAPVAGSDEVAGLARSINGMLDRLQEQRSELLHDREKLTELADALKTADRRKDEFLATLAHELRNPLAPIKNSLMVLKLKMLHDPQLAWARDVIDRQVDHMARLLDDLLDVSRITRNRLELQRARVDVCEIVEGAVETSRPLMQAAAHELTIELPHTPIYVDGDRLRLAQVFGNLLNNAAKYTPSGGHIVLAARTEGSQVVISVQDDGVGIPASQMQHIFEMFVQSSPSAQHAQAGLGIGLSLVRGLVEMHGGTVTAHSDGPGRGSVFVVRLPLYAGVDAQGIAGPPAHEPGQPPPRRILVADDNRDAAESLSMMLRLSGHEVRTAHDGLAAIEIAGWFRPAVALLDIGMPRMDGYEAARRIRSEPWGASLTLIALTGWGQQEDRKRASDAGFDHHLVKPADPATLAQLLASIEPEPAGG